jgi:branched-chain amino acid aminotransferase
MSPVPERVRGEQPRHMWIDGRLVPWEEATVHASTLGWSTMGAVFEGIKAYWNPDHQELYGWQFREHYLRFANSMKLMRMEVPYTVDDLVHASVELLRANNCRGDTYIRPIAWHREATWFGSMLGEPVSIAISTAPFTSVLGSGQVYLELPKQPHGAHRGKPARLRSADHP